MIFKNLRRKELLMTGKMNTGEERGIERIWDDANTLKLIIL